MTKRIATTELTHDNWDIEDEEDKKEPETGIAVAPEPELKRRVMLSAKRRLATGQMSAPSAMNENPTESKSGIFSAFAGFLTSKSAETSVCLNANGLDLNRSKPDSDVVKPSFSISAQVNGVHLPKIVSNKDEKEKVIFVDVDKDNSNDKMDTRLVGTSLTAIDSKRTKLSNFEPVKCDNMKNTSDSIVNEDRRHRQFCKNLKVLNEGVMNWVEKHLKSNPYLDLSPVFSDYISHYRRLEQRFSFKKTCDLMDVSNHMPLSDAKHETKSNQNEITTHNGPPSLSFAPKFNIQPSTTASSSFNFGFKSNESTTANTTQSITTAAPSFSFNQSVSAVGGSSNQPSFSFGSAQPKSTSDGGSAEANGKEINLIGRPTFSFGVASGQSASAINGITSNPAPFPFLVNQQQPSVGASCDDSESMDRNEDDDGNGNDNKYEPPVVENISVEEKDAFHSVDCKLFYKSGAKYKARGVGTLHLKKIDDDKTHLLIRADTSLGNILLNVCLTDSMPRCRVGKNNISLICVVNPPIPLPKDDGSAPKNETLDSRSETAPTALLIRVKDETEADCLLEKMK